MYFLDNFLRWTQPFALRAAMVGRPSVVSVQLEAPPNYWSTKRTTDCCDCCSVFEGIRLRHVRWPGRRRLGNWKKQTLENISLPKYYNTLPKKIIDKRHQHVSLSKSCLHSRFLPVLVIGH